MEIIKKARIAIKFKVVRPFRWVGRIVAKDEEIDIPESNQTHLVVSRRVVPCDIPEVGTYIAIKAFQLPGAVEKYEAKGLDLVSLKAEDALALMLQGVVIPKDENRWRPNNRRLATQNNPTQQQRGKNQPYIDVPNPSLPNKEVRPKIRFTKNTIVKYPDGKSEEFEKGKSGWFGEVTTKLLVSKGCAIFIG